MLLSSVETLRADLGFDDMTDINEAIKAALHAADPILQASIGTAFDRVTLADTYYVDAPGFVLGGSVQTEFRLTRGFVETILSVVRVSTIDAFGLDELSYGGDVIVAKEKGVVHDFKTNYSRQFVRITYEAGFPVSATDSESYDLTRVPLWLQEAAKLKAKILLAGSPSLEEAQIKIDVKTLSLQLNTMLSQRLRYAPVALLPL